MPITGGGSGGASSLDGLTDVVITAATAGDVLNFDGTDWINTASPHVGAGYSTKPTGFASGDISSYGRLYLGQTVGEADAYVADRVLSIKKDMDFSAGSKDYCKIFINPIAAGGTVASGTHRFLAITHIEPGASALTSGSFSVNYIDVTATTRVPSGVTASSIKGFNFIPTVNGTGTVTSIVGASCNAIGNSGGISTNVVGVEAFASGLSSTISLMAAVRVSSVTGISTTGPVTNAVAFDVQGGFANNAAVITWSGLRISTGITAAIANKWSLDLTNTSTNMGSRIAHPTAIGWNPATVAAITARLMLSAGGTAVNSSPLKFQTGGPLTAPEAGVVEFAGERFYVTPTSLERQVLPGILFTSSASAQVANTLTETTLVGAGVGDTTLNANFFIAAKTIRVRASGWIDTAAAAGTLQIRLRLGGIAGTVILDTTAVAITNNLAARYWNVDAIITCRTVGVAGTVIGQSAFQHMLTAQGNPVWWEMTNIVPVVLDTTIAEQVVLSAQWGTADPGNIIECTNFILEVLN